MTETEIKGQLQAELNRMKAASCCFVGNPMRLLPWGNDETDERCVETKRRLHMAVETAIADGATEFLCGINRGFELYCAETVREFKNAFPNIRLILTLSHQSQGKSWNESQKARLRKLLAEADAIRVLREKYSSCGLYEQYRYLLRASSRVIAYDNGVVRTIRIFLSHAADAGCSVINVCSADES